MATSSSDCGSNGYCVYEWQATSITWNLYQNKAANGYICVPPPPPGPETPDGTLVLTCAEPAST